MKIRTLEGDMEASEGDYIIKGLVGEFYPCKPDVFNRKYVQNDIKTNADRIRNMTDEELTEFLNEDLICEESETCTPSCKECRLRWLQAQVKEGVTDECR